MFNRVIGSLLFCLFLLASLNAYSRTAKIIGGTDVPNLKYPFIAAVYFQQDNGSSYSFGCGGTLIASQWVLTAAHCLTDVDSNTIPVEEVAALFGEVDLSSGGGDFVAASQLFVHPQFNNETLANDIALIRLANAVLYDPISLPDISAQFPSITENGIVAGWGDTTGGGDFPTNLMETELPIVSVAGCQIFWARVGGVLDDIMLCAGGGGAPNRDTCQGDSGGPLFVRRGPDFVLAGVTSFGNGCALDIPGGYTRVSAFYDWIESIVGSVPEVYRGPESAPALGVPPLLVALVSGDTVGESSLPVGRSQFYQVDSGSQATLATLSGDADLFVLSGRDSARVDLDCASENLDLETDQCSFENVCGVVYIEVLAFKESTFSLTIGGSQSAFPQCSSDGSSSGGSSVGGYGSIYLLLHLLVISFYKRVRC